MLVVYLGLSQYLTIVVEVTCVTTKWNGIQKGKPNLHLPHRSAIVDRTGFFVISHIHPLMGKRLGDFAAPYFQSVRIGWFSSCNIIWISNNIPRMQKNISTCHPHIVVIMPAIIPVLPTSLGQIQQI